MIWGINILISYMMYLFYHFIMYALPAMIQIKSNLYERQADKEIKTNNFQTTLPENNSDLANDYGNLINRITMLIQKNFQGQPE